MSNNESGIEYVHGIIEKPKMLWVVLIWLFIAIGYSVKGIVSWLIDVSVMDQTLVNQINMLALLPIFLLMYGVSKFNKISCVISAVVFILFFILQIIVAISRFKENIELDKNIILAFVIWGVPSIALAFWLLSKKTRDVSKKYEAYVLQEKKRKYATEFLSKKRL